MNTPISVSLDRNEAIKVIQEMLQELGPTVKIEIQQTKDTVTFRAKTDSTELLRWAERIGDRYEDVFKRLAN